MADERYKERGYSSKLVETESGAFMEIHRNGRRVAEIAVAMLTTKTEGAAMQIRIRRRPPEFRDVQIVDDDFS